MSPLAFIKKSLNALEAQRDTQNRTDMRFHAHDALLLSPVQILWFPSRAGFYVMSPVSGTQGVPALPTIRSSLRWAQTVLLLSGKARST